MKSEKNFYEYNVLRGMQKLIEKIEKEGFTEDTYTKLRLLEDDIKALNVIDFLDK